MEKKRACPSQAALEEYAVALQIGAPSPTVQAHVDACKRCKYRVKALAKESGSFLSFLQSVQTLPTSPCPETTTLAAYLDKAVDPAQKSKIDQHLAGCRLCQQTLKAIYKETDASGARETEPDYAPEPVALTGRKRTKRTHASTTQPKTDVGDTADAEQRKKRLSSDFD
ncbi:MAG TPA: zf-HC2 domain-containing protein [Candidatus Bathyarchaeia archaeon]|nr:zf-HC2 domain-containing protein [Candidatus Bathyarchaeia archaeon]